MSDRDVLERGSLRLRPLRVGDEAEWHELRRANAAWLKPWEATVPPDAAPPAMSFRSFIRLERRQRRRLEGVPLAIEVDGRLVGRMVLATLTWGAQRSASLGYWIARDHAGHGIVPTAAAMLTSHGFDLGLHRIEIAIRPENVASLRVAEKLGFTEEGLRRSYLYIDGAWRDHRVFARTHDQPRTGRYWDKDD